MRVKALRTFNISYNGELYNAYDGEIKHWDSDVVDYILNNFDDYIKLVDQKYNEFRGESTDKKPQIAPKYSLYLELDTGDFYYLESLATPSTWATIVEEQVLGAGILLWEGTVSPFEYVSDYGYYVYSGNTFSVDDIPDAITVEWDGQMYECNYDDNPDSQSFGAPWVDNELDFSKYPFNFWCVFIDDSAIIPAVSTSQEGESHSFKIYGKKEIIGDEFNFTDYHLVGEPFENDTIKVIYDGVEYEVSKDEYCAYGATWIEQGVTIDFSEYPFLIEGEPEPFILIAYEEQHTPHTVKIIGETSGTPAVWEKVGYRDGARVGTAIVGVDVVAKEE